MDNESNVYITGYSHDPSTGRSKIVILKFDKSGTFLWEKLLDLGVYKGSKGLGITTDNSSNVYVTGYQFAFNGLVGNYPKLILIKLNSSGILEWIKEGGLIFNSGIGEDLVLDKDGNIYVTAHVPLQDAALIKFDSNGDQLWIKTWNMNNSYVWSNSIALDSSSNQIYISGNSVGKGMFIVKYDLNGSIVYESMGFGGIIEDLSDINSLKEECEIKVKIHLTTDGNIIIPSFSGIYNDESMHLITLQFDRNSSNISDLYHSLISPSYASSVYLMNDTLIILGRYGNNGFLSILASDFLDFPIIIDNLEQNVYLIPYYIIGFIILLIALTFIFCKYFPLIRNNDTEPLENTLNLSQPTKGSFIFFQDKFSKEFPKGFKNSKIRAKAFLDWIEENNYEIDFQ